MRGFDFRFSREAEQERLEVLRQDVRPTTQHIVAQKPKQGRRNTDGGRDQRRADSPANGG